MGCHLIASSLSRTLILLILCASRSARLPKLLLNSGCCGVVIANDEVDELAGTVTKSQPLSTISNYLGRRLLVVEGLSPEPGGEVRDCRLEVGGWIVMNGGDCFPGLFKRFFRCAQHIRSHRKVLDEILQMGPILATMKLLGLLVPDLAGILEICKTSGASAAAAGCQALQAALVSPGTPKGSVDNSSHYQTSSTNYWGM
mmetsp:Transcript_96397/g.201396  ORF Transcript_96397/g.201396 Transcript_96397/m.201396 type:complete len:200 (+) Transcript_96397:1264-1863(+)